MRHTIFATIFLLAACSDSTPTAHNDAHAASATDESATAENAGNELIDNPNGTQTLTLEGNDSATFVDGELVEVSRAE